MVRHGPPSPAARLTTNGQVGRGAGGRGRFETGPYARGGWFDAGRRSRRPGPVRQAQGRLTTNGGSGRGEVRHESPTDSGPGPSTGSGPAHHERGVGWGCGSTRAAEGLWPGSPRTDRRRRAGRRRRLYGRWDRGRRDDGSARYSIRAERPTTSRIRISASCPSASVRRSSSPGAKWTGWGWPWLIAMLEA